MPVLWATLWCSISPPCGTLSDNSIYQIRKKPDTVMHRAFTNKGDRLDFENTNNLLVALAKFGGA